MAKLLYVKLSNRKGVMNRLIQDCWQIIHQSNIKPQHSLYLPLENLKTIIEHFHLQPLPSRPMDHKLPIVSLEKPAFFQLSHEKLACLRLMIYQSHPHSSQVYEWAEKLIRFIEINYAIFKKRILGQWKPVHHAQLLCLHASSFLLDYTILNRDLRGLNSVLKLMDLKWIYQKKDLCSVLETGTHSALFQLRLLLVSEYIIDCMHFDVRGLS